MPIGCREINLSELRELPEAINALFLQWNRLWKHTMSEIGTSLEDGTVFCNQNQEQAAAVVAGLLMVVSEIRDMER